MKIFENWNQDDSEDIVSLWLSDNDFYNEGGKWNTISTFSIIVPDFMVNKKGELKVKFGKVEGNFEIDCYNIKSLKGCPYYVGGDFEVVNTLLESLEYMPADIKGGLNVSGNRLKNLIGLSESSIGTYINISKNELTSIDGCQFKINGSFNCSNNKLTDLKGCPVEIAGNFNCSNNKLISLNYSPKYVNGTKNIDNNIIPETEILFYEETESYNNYYEDLLKWIMTNDKIEHDLDTIDWPEEFLKNKGSILRSVRTLNKYNLNFKLN